MSDRRTDLPTHRAPNFEQRVREVLQTYLGRQGDPLDRGLTLRDLLQAGVVKVREGFTLRTGMAEVPISAGDAVAPAYEPDLSAPPMPSGFEVAAAITHVFVKHDAPAYQQGHGPLRTRLYGVTLQAGDPLPTFDDAVEIAQFSGAVYAHPTNPSTTWRLWVRWESVDGGLSLPAGGTNGLQATTGEDVGLLLDALAGKIGEPALLASLNSRINLIDAPTTGLTTKVAGLTSQVASIQSTLADFEAMPEYDPAATYAAGDLVKYSGGLYRATAATTGNLPTDTAYWEKVGDYASLGDAVAAHAFQLADHETRIEGTETALAAEVSARQTLAATVGSNTAAIQTEATTRANADTALASSITTLTSAVNDNAAAIQTEASARATETGQLLAQYTVKVDVNGYVSGFGLASTLNSATPFSEFAIVADKFSIAPVATNPAAADGSPFFHLTAPTVIDGVTVPAGTYMKQAYIHNAAINTAQIKDAAITDAKISNLSATKITAGTIAADRLDAAVVTAKVANLNAAVITQGFLNTAVIQDGTITDAKIANEIKSTNYVAGTAGWRITKAGTIEAQDLNSRGSVTVGRPGNPNEWAVVRSDGKDWWYNNNAGFIMAHNKNYAGSGLSYSLLEFRGGPQALLRWRGGTHPDAASGVLEVSGVLTADAVDAVNTVNIAGQAVTFPNHSRATWTRYDGNYTASYYGTPGGTDGW